VTQRQKVPITMRALIQRINRKLREHDEVLKAIRGERWRAEYGDYYVLNCARNYVTEMHVDPEKLGRELKVMQDWEVLAE
jgi:hypothetical protein